MANFLDHRDPLASSLFVEMILEAIAQCRLPWVRKCWHLEGPNELDWFAQTFCESAFSRSKLETVAFSEQATSFETSVTSPTFGFAR